ncbi:MAG TPA: tRNA 2-thiouridine(34) synthase MnmA [Candidatus Udaeobacter sp.]|nr:tRNA 2-thiouridine(34) synthase MnmA [Candidatus Udaeobacter sp.]
MNRKKQRVLLGMSGGVDSSVAGYLLREQGYEVIGVTMKVWPQDCISRAEDKCCGPEAIADARGVAHSLGIPHYVVDEADLFERLVIDYFSSEYRAGRTPNPCVMCNEKLKFGNLWSKAAALGCDYIATGHYAIIEHVVAAGGDRGRMNSRVACKSTGVDDSGYSYAILRKGRDPRKDQSYFLFSLRQPQLRRALTPLGKMMKPQIREIAHSLGLKVADKVDSQEICFVPGNDYKAFLRSHLGENEFHRGEIYDVAGNFLGEHDGIELFTIGQRKGLPGGSPRPRYVVDLDPATNRVIVGDADDLVTDEFEIDRVNWICDIGQGFHGGANSCEPGVAGAPSSKRLEVTAKIRYSHPGTRATLTQLEDGHAHVRLHDPQRAVTPGQAAVFYDGDVVLGGGWICRSSRPERSPFDSLHSLRVNSAKSKDAVLVP